MWHVQALISTTESTESNGEHCVVMHSPPRLLWGLSRKKKKSTEELQEWKMLVCQFVTKAVCSCVIDWQTVLAHYPWGHTGYCCRVTFFFFFFRSFSHFLKQTERQREATESVSWSRHAWVLLGFLCLWKFMAWVGQKVHNQLLWHGG